MEPWLEKELSTCRFKDKRLEKRFKDIVSTLASETGKTIPEVCEQWSTTKAMYRFLSNDRVDEDEILSGHFNQTSERIDATHGPILVLHDTTEFTYSRSTPEDIGYTRKLPIGKKSSTTDYKACGILMHGSLAVTPEGLPLGLTASKFWTRKVFKETESLKRKINPTRIPIHEKESIKWIENLNTTHKLIQSDASKLVHIGDRENDIYEYFCRCFDLNTYFITRCCVNRLANETTLVEEVASQAHCYKHHIDFTNEFGKEIQANLEIKMKWLTLHPPKDKQNGNYSHPFRKNKNKT